MTAQVAAARSLTAKFFATLVLCCTLAAGGRCYAQGRLEIDAFRGTPFGVGKITVVPRITAGPRPPGIDLPTITERRSRVYYPAYESTPVRQVIREFLAARPRVSVYFLFEGNEPLDLSLGGPTPLDRTVVPVDDPAAHSALLRAWWREYTAPLRLLGRSGDYPPDVENYLKLMLGARLGLEVPADSEGMQLFGKFDGELGLLLGTETARLAAMRQVMTRNASASNAATEPLPKPIELASAAIPATADVMIEPIAMRVPEECFYIHFGNYGNFQWLRHRLDAWGGDSRNLIVQRGVDFQLNERIQRQLILRESALAKFFGEAVVADVAIVGMDPFMKEGAALGVLFQVRNVTAYASDIVQQRAAALKKEPGAKEEKLKLAGHDVSFVSTPDNRLRSYYISDGEYQFVTTSRALAERFVETAQGTRPLGASPMFRYARSRFPATGSDTAFAYFSPEFFANLASPHYRIEMDRRMRSLAEIEVLQLAQLAAKGERRENGSIEALASGGFVPTGFGGRADGSRFDVASEAVSDSLRGALGTFKPIPDVEFDRVTPSEARAFQQFADTVRDDWKQFDPLVVTIRRKPASQKGLEQVTLDAVALPMAAGHSQMVSRWLGPPMENRLLPLEGEPLSMQVSLRGGSPLTQTDGQFFGAARGVDPGLSIEGPKGGFLLLPRNVIGYLGAWPQPGVLSLLGSSAQAQTDAEGYSRLPGGVSRRQFDQFTVMSFQQELLREVTPQFRWQKAAEPAQLWVHAEDLSQSKVAEFVNLWGYHYAKQMSAGNLRYLHDLAEQLHVADADCLTVAESILGAKLVCSLGGKYELGERAGGGKAWTSTALVDKSGRQITEMPQGYQFPALHWVRGLNASLRLGDGTLAAHVEVLMPADTPALGEGLSLPLPGFSRPSAPSKPPAEAPKKSEPLPEPIPTPKPRDF